MNMAVRWGYISRRERNRGGEGGTNEQSLSDKPPLIRCGEICSTEGKSEISVQKLGLFIQSSYSLTLFPAETIAMK